MPRPYKALTVAYFFLELGEKDGIAISPMKLQKLIYFAHGWCLALFDSALIEESVDAWRYGPVIVSVYFEFKEFGSTPIKSVKPSVDIEYELGSLHLDQETINLITKVWDVFKGFNAIQLSAMTHLPGTPWVQARQSTEKANVTISDNLIKDYFREQTMQPAGSN